MSASVNNPEQVASALLPTIFAHTRSRASLCVLDLGAGVGQTINTLTAHRPCRFFFADIGQHFRSNPKGRSPELLPRIVPPDIKFDICFFWDYLNLIHDGALRQFAEELDPHLNEDTLIHGFVATSARAPMSYTPYKLVSADSFVRVDQNDYMARYPKSLADFEKAFPRLRCERVVLFPGNRQELLAAVAVTR